LEEKYDEKIILPLILIFYYERGVGLYKFRYLRVIVSGREVWDMDVREMGNEHRSSLPIHDETFGKGVFKDME